MKPRTLTPYRRNNVYTTTTVHKTVAVYSKCACDGLFVATFAVHPLLWSYVGEIISSFFFFVVGLLKKNHFDSHSSFKAILYELRNTDVLQFKHHPKRKIPKREIPYTIFFLFEYCKLNFQNRYRYIISLYIFIGMLCTYVCCGIEYEHENVLINSENCVCFFYMSCSFFVTHSTAASHFHPVWRVHGCTVTRIHLGHILKLNCLYHKQIYTFYTDILTLYVYIYFIWKRQSRCQIPCCFSFC